MLDKQKKESLLYVYEPNSSYICSECVFSKEQSSGQIICTFFNRENQNINWYGSCNYWIFGTSGSVEGPHAKTKVQSGYVENKPGLQCRRCEYFNSDYKKCKKVDETSPGDSPGIIHPKGCCDAWDKSDTYGPMTDSELDSFKKLR